MCVRCGRDQEVHHASARLATRIDDGRRKTTAPLFSTIRGNTVLLAAEGGEQRVSDI